MHLRTSFVCLMLGAGAGAVWADTITFNGQTYTDVYVTKGSKLYYVSLPEDGSVINVPFDQASGVTITADIAARGAIYKKWQTANNKKRGISEPVVPAPQKPRKPAARYASPSVDSSASDTASDIPPETASQNAYARELRLYQQRIQSLQMNAATAAARRQREAARMHKLRNVRVITSQDAASGGVVRGIGARRR